RDPLARAVRPDKVLLAAIAATLALYRAGLATRDIPIWRQVATTLDELDERARTLLANVKRAGAPVLQVAEIESALGGGSLPGQTLPSRGIRIVTSSPQRLLAALRSGDPAVIARIEQDHVILDFRTVDPGEDASLAAALDAALAGARGAAHSRT
ncbi:MAG: L-seryl-tRNA(Sec) selenium transferase, partial [Chloroflexota bacterium]